MSKKPQETPLELAKKYAIPAAIAIAIPVLGFFLGFVFLFVLLIGAAAAFAFKPLSTPRVTKEFNNRKFSHLKIDDECKIGFCFYFFVIFFFFFSNHFKNCFHYDYLDDYIVVG